MRRSLLALLGFLALCYLVAAIGGTMTAPAIPGWYVTLPKPAWTPPNWLFGPVWTLLYTMMAVAAWLIWRTRGGLHNASLPLGWFAIQLLLNLLWTLLFFGLHQPAIAFVEILLLWGAIFMTWRHFRVINRVAGWLLVPYLIWVAYAAALNLAIARQAPMGSGL
jgi:benzodiazapine receptor